MQVSELMTAKPEYIHTNTTLREAARKMRDLDVGFLPVADSREQRLEGVVTDRDIAIRGVAEGCDPDTTCVSAVETDKVLYCFKDDDVEDAVASMGEQKVYRLVVLDDRDNKKLCGVISLGDVLRRHERKIAAKTAEGIVA
ncbi:CBS domain-containing protein [Thioalkalivibrio sp. XN279]|uniref:CBS domain-containing protein n=1 Tax=Thioalkalivibrio sp. XN279 TaxID=2714953 RepID=UPI001408718F|nr:CBS domain-containing protein [Thioalkalivibrio sp. XN279]NHA14062.1 CBS domain-containing protein [Thioalkalivibrio sp. XN279]